MRNTLGFVPLRCLLSALLMYACSLHAQKVHDVQNAILSLAPTASDAVIPITAWSNFSQPNTPRFAVVIGTGFLVDREGHFITAAHVANTKQFSGVDVQLKANIRQKSRDASAQVFSVVDVDSDHDLALCQIAVFKVYSPRQSPTAKAMKNVGAGPGRTDVTHPFASLQVSKREPSTGRIVLVSGFPLGSWTPTVQLGLVSATNTIYPPPAPRIGVPKDSGDLLQISVNANHGNSGGPIIDLTTGEVIGVLLQLVPAPLAIGGQLHYDAGTHEMSGLMLAAPAAWVNALLSKNKIQSEGTRSGKFVIW